MIHRIIYWVMVTIALVVYSLQKLTIPLPKILNNYANDLLCLPLVLGFITFGIRKLKNDEFFKLPLFIILIMALYYSVYFEYYLPTINPRYTSDWIDVGLYFAGALGFYTYERTVVFEKIKFNSIK